VGDYVVRDNRQGRPSSSGIVVARGAGEVRRAIEGREAAAALDRGRSGPAPTSEDELRMMRLSRRTAAQQRFAPRTAAAIGTSGSASLSYATQRPRDPMFYWRDSSMPYEIEKEEDLVNIRKWCRFIYRSDPVLASCVDVFAKYPTLGMELTCKDSEVVSFHETLFFDQLDYEEFLVDLSREYWLVGEAFPLASFNELLGVWEADELVDPDHVRVERTPFLKEPRLSMRLSDTLRKVLRERQPVEEYQALVRSYPELLAYLGEDDLMPVSNVLLKHVRFKGETFAERGVPLMMRAFRPALQEEMLNAAQDAIADRLYTPLVLARIGASAQDLGTQRPWVPTEEDLANFEANLDAALAADFRVLTTHFAVQMDSVFGRETMPNFDADFERLTERKLQVFGLSKTMLSGAGQGETYAADALNRDLVTQLLSTHQRRLRKFVRDRMLVVAEAQGHYDYEESGGRRTVLYEEVLVRDEETDEDRIEQRPKLLVPDLTLASMNLRDEDTRRQFFEALRMSGVPISMKTRLNNTPVVLDDEIEASREEQVTLAVEAQLTRRATYEALVAQKLPIPPDLASDFRPLALPPPGEGGAGPVVQSMPGARPPQLGVDDPAATALAPTPDELAVPAGVPGALPLGPAGAIDPAVLGMAPPGGGPVVGLPRNQARPPESDEMRAGMPVAASLHDDGDEEGDSPPAGVLSLGPRHVGKRWAPPALSAVEPDEAREAG
jgi:hypothetical protein